MNKYVVTLALILSASTSVCGQDYWGKWIDQHRLPEGTALSITYHAPPDSGEVHVAFVSLDSTYCYGGYQVLDYFPPQKNFDVTVRWKECGEGVTVATDSTSLQYRGEEKTIVYRSKSHPAERGAVFALTVGGAAGSDAIRRVKDWRDLEGLPSASQTELRAFLQDSLGWHGP